MRAFIPVLALGITALFACADGPTETQSYLLDADAPVLKNGATGAMLGVPEDFDFSGLDEDGNGDGIVCVKTVPAGNGQGATRTIAKDNKNGTCPGGFEETTLGLPACSHLQPVSGCDCSAGVVVNIPPLGGDVCDLFGGN